MNLHLRRDLVEKWRAALLSGEYSQCQERLSDGDGYCCLGVLADIIDPSKWLDEDYQNLWDGHETNLPENVMALKEQDVFTELNDNHGWDFNDIGTYLGKVLATPDLELVENDG